MVNGNISTLKVMTKMSAFFLMEPSPARSKLDHTQRLCYNLHRNFRQSQLMNQASPTVIGFRWVFHGDHILEATSTISRSDDTELRSSWDSHRGSLERRTQATMLLVAMTTMCLGSRPEIVHTPMSSRCADTLAMTWTRWL